MLRVGISACLLGAEVRWDGGHRQQLGLMQNLAAEVEWVSVCPEVEIGMGVPRETIHLRRIDSELRLVGTSSGRDWSAAMQVFSERRIAALAALDLDGYILKSGSPSCGLKGVPIYDARGAVMLHAEGAGRFAAELRRNMPRLPLAEERDLTNSSACEQFLERARSYREWKQTQAED